jgi:3-oxoadipate enol-lactonase
MNMVANNVRVEYSIAGDQGPWLLLSHSLGCDMSMWDAQISELSSKYRVLRYDTRGHGKSETTSGAYSLDELAEDAHALLDALGINQVIWIGFSMGGMIGQTFALKYPKRLLGLVLADTTSQHDATPQSVWDERIRVAKELGIEPLVAPAIGRWFTQEFRQTHPEDIARIAKQISNTSMEGWCGCCAAISAIHTTENLHEISQPTLVIVGEHDIGTPLAAALTLQRRLPNSNLVVITESAHMTCIEQPAQFNRALRMFLKANFL